MIINETKVTKYKIEPENQKEQLHKLLEGEIGSFSMKFGIYKSESQRPRMSVKMFWACFHNLSKMSF